MAGPALNKPQSKWTVVLAFVLAAVCHVAPVALVEMNRDVQPAEVSKAIDDNRAPRAIGSDSIGAGL